MKTKNISKLYRLTNESLGMLSHRIIDTVVLSEIEQALNGKQYQQHIAINARYRNALEPRNQKAISAEIEYNYKARNTLFYSMFDYVKGLLNAPDEELKTAAALIFAVTNKYGRSFSNVKIAEQSIRFIRVIEGLKNPNLADALQKLQLTDKVSELDNIQRQYEDLYMGRTNRRMAIETPGNLRKELISAIKLHIEELRWMAKQTESAELQTLADAVTSRIGEVTVSLSRKKPDIDSVNEPESDAVA